MAMKDDEPVIGIQSTSKHQFYAHLSLLLKERHDSSRTWLKSGNNRLLLIGWYKDGRIWQPKEREIFLADLTNEIAGEPVCS